MQNRNVIKTCVVIDRLSPNESKFESDYAGDVEEGQIIGIGWAAPALRCLLGDVNVQQGS